MAFAISWKRNLIFAWLSQVLSMMGFGFALPFIAYYLQKDLGVTDIDAAKRWAALCNASTFFFAAIVAPIWGLLADRYGRKLMMLRANFCAMLIIGLMAAAPNPWVLLMLRSAQGAFTGTMTAAQALVASYTPQRRQGIALGAMSAAVFAGTALGMFLGGECASVFRYRPTFLIGGALLGLSFLMVLFGVREQFERSAEPAREDRASKRRMRLPSLGYGGPILLLIAFLAFARNFDRPMVPFLLQEIFPVKDAAGYYAKATAWMGRTMAFASIGAFVGGFFWGRVADRIAPTRIVKFCALAAALCIIPQMLAQEIGVVIAGRIPMAFFGSGLAPVIFIWLSRVTDPARRARIFGWAFTAQALGISLGAAACGQVGAMWGARTSLFAAAALQILAIPLVSFVRLKVAHPVTDGVVGAGPEVGPVETAPAK
jgi:DHA1 family multidrug resistance protein-like MFS transporter